MLKQKQPLVWRERAVGREAHPLQCGAPLRPGTLVQIKSEAEILCALDERGQLDGMPFTEEMRQFCGRVYPILAEPNRIYLEGQRICQLVNTVLLKDVRCDGTAHGGCQRLCLLFWKKDWLCVPGSAAMISPPDNAPCTFPSPTRSPSGVMQCPGQSIVLMNATSSLSPWHIAQYIADLRSGSLSFLDHLRIVRWELGKQTRWWRKKCFRLLPRLFPGRSTTAPAITHLPAPSPPLQSGELVEILSAEEIEASIAADHVNRGLAFTIGMRQFCGKRYQVLQRVERLIDEIHGQTRHLKNTVILEGVRCDGIPFRGCPRACYWFWRESWLRRVDEPDTR